MSIGSCCRWMIATWLGCASARGGALVLSSLPHHELAFSMTQLTPVSTGKDVVNYFHG